MSTSPSLGNIVRGLGVGSLSCMLSVGAASWHLLSGEEETEQTAAPTWILGSYRFTVLPSRRQPGEMGFSVSM